MEFLQSHRKMLPAISVLFLLHLSSLFFPAFSYTLPDYYFINCGSAASPTAYQRKFTGDDNPTNYVLSAKDTTSAADQTLPAHQLYQTARIFKKSSFYELNLDQDGIFMVRLHFFPFPSLGNLVDARFQVSASGFSLLSNFSLESGSRFPLVEEFLIKVVAGKFKILFKPYGKERSFAFVNAIEVFLAPPEFVRDPPHPPRVTREGSDGSYDGVLDSPLHVVHRINVGGGDVTRETDTMMRYWIPDDAYLLLNNTAIDKFYDHDIEYKNNGEGATRFDAPDSVYKTAKEMNVGDGKTLTNFNVSWRFGVRKGAMHLVRLHFCDIVSRTPDENNGFNLYVYSGFSQEVSPWDVTSELASPFYMDLVVESDDSGFMNLSIGPHPESKVKTAFLNGVEIMELLGGEVAASGGDSSRKRLFIVIGSCVGGVILVAIVFVLLLLVWRKRKLKAAEALEWPLVPLYGGSTDSRATTVRTSVTGSPFADLNLGLKIPLSGILFATRKFDAKLIIGEGGFGKVYKGMLRNGRKVAIKRSEAGNGQGFEEFHTEIMLLSKIRHNHLVSLIGYCDERDEMILVYEFMEMGTLREHLYSIQGESKERSSTCEFSWVQRLEMCIGAAKGLHYLHTGSAGTIIHRDIKSTNILLDENYVAKVADFGLSRSGPLDQTHVSTEVKGSFGYLDPEYFRCLQLTQKSDVYSFGVVLLEVLCARPAIDPLLPREQVNLADWGLLWQRKGQLENVLDPFLVGKINPNSLRKFGETVEKCLQECGADRPHMVDVSWDLQYCLQLQHSAVPRQPYEDSTTEVSWGLGMPAVQRLPSQSFNVDEDETPQDSFSVADSSQLNASEVFSQLNMDGAR